MPIQIPIDEYLDPNTVVVPPNPKDLTDPLVAPPPTLTPVIHPSFRERDMTPFDIYGTLGNGATGYQQPESTAVRIPASSVGQIQVPGGTGTGLEAASPYRTLPTSEPNADTIREYENFLPEMSKRITQARDRLEKEFFDKVGRPPNDNEMTIIRSGAVEDASKSMGLIAPKTAEPQNPAPYAPGGGWVQIRGGGGGGGGGGSSGGNANQTKTETVTPPSPLPAWNPRQYQPDARGYLRVDDNIYAQLPADARQDFANLLAGLGFRNTGVYGQGGATELKGLPNRIQLTQDEVDRYTTALTKPFIDRLLGQIGWLETTTPTAGNAVKVPNYAPIKVV